MCNIATTRGIARILFLGALMSTIDPSHAKDATKLFKIVTVKDEIVVGLTPKDSDALGGDDVGHLGRALKSSGEVTVWQYAVRKGKDGELEQAPLRRISVLGHDSLRVEPYASPLRVVPAE